MIKAINRSIAARHEEDEKGFTLIELLVVILIIGVLAAIAIPAFLNQREGAWASQVESDLKNAAIAAAQHSTENNGSYTGLETAVSAWSAATPSVLTVGPAWKAAGFNATEGVSIVFAPLTGADAGEYTLTGTHKDRGTDNWVYASKDGVITYTAGS